MSHNNNNDFGADIMRVFYKYTSRLAIAAMLFPLPAYSGGYKFSDGDKFLEVGARIQLQYKVESGYRAKDR